MSDRNSAPTAAHSNPDTSGTPVMLQCYCGRPGCTTPDECRRNERGAEISWWRGADRPVNWGNLSTAKAV
jgi:hypothetical protein